MTKRTHARTRFDAPPRHPREAAEERIVAQLAERMRAAYCAILVDVLSMEGES